MISWKNPGPGDRDLSMEDYREFGVMAALEAVTRIVPREKIHAVGYCIGGTLLSIAAAAMARDGDDRLKSATFFAAQTDFAEAGELMLFIDESQLAFLEDVMWEQGFLDSRQMAGTFQLLRSNDLIWSRMVHTYLMGEREPMTDLNAWNADGTRIPYRQHAEYLRRLFLDNDLAEGRFPAGGHNAGVVSEPGHPRRHYRVATKLADDHYIDSEVWLTTTPVKEGSWWSEWVAWLDASSGARVLPPPMGALVAGCAPLCKAPGTYVLES